MKKVIGAIQIILGISILFVLIFHFSIVSPSISEGSATGQTTDSESIFDIIYHVELIQEIIFIIGITIILQGVVNIKS